MRRLGAPARKEGERQPNGRLRYRQKLDRGNDVTLEQRSIMVGRNLAASAYAGYPLGVLKLKGLLADEKLQGQPEKSAAQNEERFRAGLNFAAHHAIVWGGGPARPKSHLLAAIEGIRRGKGVDAEPTKFVLDAAERYGRMVAAVRLLPGPSNPFPFHILERIALADEFALTALELDALRRALHALVQLDGGG